jgi:quinol monooxygenase YgiN
MFTTDLLPALACPCDRCWLQAAPLWNDHPRCSPWPWRGTAGMVKGGSDMWAQLMRFRVRPGKDTAGLREQLQAVEQPDSGLLRTMIMQDQKDPDQFYTLVVFESEEKARARERDPRRQEGLQVLRAMLADRLAGPPEFTDLAVVEDWTG